MVFTRRQSKATSAVVEPRTISASDLPETPTKIPARISVSKSTGHKHVKRPLTSTTEAQAEHMPSNVFYQAEIEVSSKEHPQQQETPHRSEKFKLSRSEMHPQLEKRTSTTPYEASQWLGFFNMQPKTEPRQIGSKIHNASPESPTPLKTISNITAASAIPQAAYEFTFRQPPLVALSAEARQIMNETRAEAAAIRAQLAAEAAEKSRLQSEGEQISRKFAKPSGRFSDVHSAAFGCMDSIADHPSAWRTAKQPDSAQSTTRGPLLSTLKRSRSKAELGATTSEASDGDTAPSDEVIRGAKRARQEPASPTKCSVTSSHSRSSTVAKTSLRGIASALYTPTKSTLARSKSASSLKRTQIPALVRQQANNASKTSPHRNVTGGVVRPASSSLSPTKSSTQRAQEPAPALTPTIKISSPVMTTAGAQKHVTTPSATSAIPRAAVTPTPARIKDMPLARPLPRPPLDSPSPQSGGLKIKSILRTPVRLYSNDPAKIAAGTHMATPPSVRVPATAPVTKHVVFSASARLKAARDEAKAGSEEPEITYPQIPSTAPQQRQMPLQGEPRPIPGDFTFRAGTEIKFGSPAASTIRAVRSSDQSPATLAVMNRNKRKLDDLDDSGLATQFDNDKENVAIEMDIRPLKRARHVSASPSKMPIKRRATGLAGNKSVRTGPASSKAKVGSQKRSGGMSASRLAFLAQPKKR